MTADSAGASAEEWLACFCCGISFPSDRLVHFQRHPEQGVCIPCVGWLDDRSRIIGRRMYVPFRWRNRKRRAQES